MNTAQRLGYGKEQKLLIVNADDFGLCRSVNETVVELLKEGAIRSTTIMMCSAWSADAIARFRTSVPHAGIGIHWTLTSEWPAFKWGPVCRSRSTSTLAAAGGWFPETVAEIERTADPEEVRCELIAQTDVAICSDLSPTHADNHMGSLYGIEERRPV